MKRYIVVGWALKSPAASNNDRVPLGHMTISDVSPAGAAATYARCMGIRPEWWRDGSGSPLIVVRVAPERAGKSGAR